MDDQVCPALRRNAEIGTLYDAKTDRFLNTSILPSHLSASYVSTQPDGLTEITVSSCASYGDVFKDLHIDETTAVNILSGIVDVQGATLFLRDFTTSGGTVRSAIIHQVSTVQQTIFNLSETFRSSSDLTPLRTNDCTHVVTGIRWGLQTVVTASYPIPSKSGQSGDEEATFKRDLEVLKSSMESAHLTPRAPPEMEICNEITLYSDAFENEGLIMEDVSEVCNFIRIVPDHIQQESGGKGWPIAYTITPITALSYVLPLPKEFQYSLKPIRVEYLANFIQLFDEFEASASKLQSYYAYIIGHMRHVDKSHILEVFDSMETLERKRAWAINKLFYGLTDMRTGKGDPSVLIDLHHSAISEEPTPKQLSAIAGQETDKLEFIAGVIAQGAKYIGRAELSPEAVMKAHKDTFYYILHFDAASMDQKEDWNDNCTLLLELLGQPDDRVPVYIMDYDATCSNVHLEAPRITQYKGEKECIADVLEHRQFLSSKCFARSCDASLDTSMRERPLKRSFVKIPCPCPGCDSKHAEWMCPQCLTEIEYGINDELFYCACGGGSFSTFEFRCNDTQHGSGYEKYDTEELRKLLSGLNQADYINILILGETGVGKSTFINAFVNYLSYTTLDQAKAADKLNSVIPCSFSLQTMDRENLEAGIQEYNVKVGAREDEVDGSTGNSATQKSAVYPVNVGGKTYRLIDTPGIGDTRGLSYDKENMADILRTISSYEELHGILVLVKSNNARLTVTFRFCVKELLTHLHRSAAKNMAFGFTNTRISNYAPGDTFKPLKSLLDDHADIPITLSTSTTYCFDSESFRYLAACKQNVPVTNEEDVRRSWDHSSKEAHRLVDYFASTPPHPVTSTLSLNGTRKLILELTKPMANISECIRKNIRLCEDQKRELNDTRLTAHNLRRRLRLEKIQFVPEKLAKPRTVCKNADCCDFKDSGLGNGEVVTIYKTHCHPVCSLKNVKEDVIADPGLIKCWAFRRTSASCRQCYHQWQEHLHVLNELSETKVEVTDTEIERQLKANADDVTLRQTGIARLDQTIKEYNQELDELRRAAARFCLFMRENAITIINDATLDYLDMLILDEQGVIETGKQRGIPMEANIKRLQALKDDRQIHIQLVETFKQNMNEPTCSEDRLLDEKGVDTLVKRLYELKHFGKDLEHIKYIISSSLEGTFRERPFRVQVPNRSKHTRRSGRRRDSGCGRGRGGGPKRNYSPSSYSPTNKNRKGRVEGGGGSADIALQPAHLSVTYAEAVKSGFPCPQTHSFLSRGIRFFFPR